MDTKSALDWLLLNYKELGAGSFSGVLAIAFGYHKYITKHIETLTKETEAGQNDDKNNFKLIDSQIENIKNEVKQIQFLLEQEKNEFGFLKQDLNKMIAGLEANTESLLKNSHKIEITENMVNILKGVLEDATRDIKEIQKGSQKLEVAFAKVIGTLSRKID